MPPEINLFIVCLRRKWVLVAKIDLLPGWVVVVHPEL